MCIRDSLYDKLLILVEDKVNAVSYTHLDVYKRQVQLTANQAARDFEAAIDNAAESLKRNGKTLDIHTPKGLSLIHI